MRPIRRLANLFFASNNLKQAVGILFVTVLISNILGLLRNIIIANRVGITYGTIGPLDNYYAAFVLPDLIYNLLIVGALSSAVLPLLVNIDSSGDDAKFWKTFNTLLSTGFTAIIIALAVLFIVLPHIMPLVLPGFTESEVELTTQLAQVMLLSPLFFTLSQISTSALQAKRYFLASALAPILYNLAIISGALLIPRFELPVLVFGVIIGAAAHFLVQLPTLVRLGWRFHFEVGFGNEAVRHVFTLMIPRAIALTSTQLLLVAFYRLASHFQEGSIAIYRLVDDLQTAPVLLLANTLAMAVLPDFARHLAQDNNEEFKTLVGKSLRLILFMFLPITLYLIIFARPIMDVYISVGHSISADEVSLAVRTFTYFAISLFFQGAILLLARAYFARQDTMRPTVYGVISLLTAWLAAILFANNTDLGVAGLALAYSIGSTLNALLLWFNLKLPFSVILRDSLGRKNMLWVIFGTVMATATFLLSRELYHVVFENIILGSPTAHNVIEIILGFIAGFSVYWLISRTAKLEQWELIRPRGSTTT